MEYDKELASRLLTETMRELPGYLISVKAKEDDESFLTICALECFAEYHIRHLFYKKLLNMWPDKNYMHAKDLIADLITIGGKIEDDETTLKMLWRKADGHDVNMGKMFWRVEDSPYGIYLGFYDGFVEPLNFSYSSSYSAEAIFIMDDMSKSIWKRIPSVLPLLNMLDPDEIKKRQEEIKNKKKKMKDLKIFANIVEDAAVKMINQIAENEYFDNFPIRIMPDTHAGKGIVVGFTCPMGTHINPDHIGGDIGCGIETIIFDKILPDEQYALFEQRVRNEIPMGKNIDYTDNLDHRQLYAQALHLFNSKQRYWLENDEIQELIKENEPFQRTIDIVEMIGETFRKPKEGEGRWYGTYEILNLLAEKYDYFDKKTSPTLLGKSMNNYRFNFKKRFVNGLSEYLLIEK